MFCFPLFYDLELFLIEIYALTYLDGGLNFDIFFFSIDVNECDANPDLCMHGQCVNTEGGFNCLCDYGYVPSQNQRACLGEYFLRIILFS